jgi:hypothetical protein
MAKGDLRATGHIAKKSEVAARSVLADKPMPSRPPLTKPARTAKGSTAPGEPAATEGDGTEGDGSIAGWGPRDSAAPGNPGGVTSRTKTLDDPLTTSLLAEIARRPATVDVLPEQLAAALDLSRDDGDPDDST